MLSDSDESLGKDNAPLTTYQIAKNKKIAKYGEDGYKRMEAIKKQLQRITDQNEIEKLKKELKDIKGNPEKKVQKKEKLTTDEKKAKDAERKRQKRADEMAQYGRDVIRERWAKERQERRMRNNA